MSMGSLPPPPRRLPSSASSAAARRPKVNPNSLTLDQPLEAEDPSVDRALAQLLSQTRLSQPDHHHPQSEKDGDDSATSATLSPRSEYVTDGVGPFASSCSYCSSVRSNSVASIFEDPHGGGGGMAMATACHNHQHLHHHTAPSLEVLFDDRRMDYLRTLVPTEVRRRLTFHLDECWFAYFSPSAEYLVSIGLDRAIVIWKDIMSPDPSIHKILNFPRAATHVEWSPDSRYLLANFGNDIFRPELVPKINLIDVETGEILFKRSYKNDTRFVWANAVGWFSDSKRFVTALDDGLYCIWNVEGEMLKEYVVETDLTAEHLRMIPGTDSAVIVTKDLTLDIISFGETLTTRRLERTTSLCMTMSVSRDGSYLAVGKKREKDLLRPAQIALYDLNAMTYLRSFEAESYVDDVFVIIPAFTGPNLELLCAGSENGKLHFWDIESGELVSVLEEHMMHAGCITVHPDHPGMIASCSDDNTIIIWTTKELQQRLQDDDEKWAREHRAAAMPTIDLKKGW